MRVIASSLSPHFPFELYTAPTHSMDRAFHCCTLQTL